MGWSKGVLRIASPIKKTMAEKKVKTYTDGMNLSNI